MGGGGGGGGGNMKMIGVNEETRKRERKELPWEYKLSSTRDVDGGFT